MLLFVFNLNLKAQGQSEESTSKGTRDVQVTFVPGLSTSNGIDDSLTNKLSFNILLGKEHSLDGFEIGLLYNYDREFVKGLQWSGFGNSTSGTVTGAQFAGFINTAKGPIQGAQLSGFTNYSKSDVKGAQLTGFVNVAQDSVMGGQFAGFANINRNGIKGAQAAGFVNVASEVKGAQLAGFLNVAKHVRGSQVALINVADSVNKGVTFGLFNFIKTGIIQPSIRYNEVFDGNFYFSSGTKNLYTILLVGSQFQDSTSLWTYGGGFGTQFQVAKRWKFNLELTTQHINPKNVQDNTLNLLNRVGLDFGFDVGRHFSMTAGPVINVYVTQKYDQETGIYGDDIGLSTFYDDVHGDTAVKMWVGYNAAIRF